jgi:hypothetical protein
MLGTRQTARLAQAMRQPEATLLVLSKSTHGLSAPGHCCNLREQERGDPRRLVRSAMARSAAGW